MKDSFLKSAALVLLVFCAFCAVACANGIVPAKVDPQQAEQSLSYINEFGGVWIPKNFSEDGDRYVSYSNELYSFVFDRKGATVKSALLNAFRDNGDVLELVLSDDDEDRAFVLYPGRDLTDPLDGYFDVVGITADSVVFECPYTVDGKDAVVRKAYDFSNRYMFRVSVDVAGDVAASGKYFWTLEFGPQLGPAFQDNNKARQNDRNFYLKKESKKKKLPLKFSSGIWTYEGDFEWMELTGKYFTLAMVPEKGAAYDVASYTDNGPNARMYLSRESDSASGDVYVYLGPQLKDTLKVFTYPEDNSFGLKDLKLEKAMDGGGSLSWLQNILKWIMSLFYRIIPNWGVSIVFVTVLIKILLYPLNARSARSAAAMQQLAPEMEAIRKQYKDDPVKLNAATMALYKKNGISPMSGMLPMLIQLPILFAVFGLLNKHFELRGAMFVPGWIEDLSAPETVCTLPFSMPFLGPDIHLLPVIYCVSMVLSMLWTQRSNPTNSGAGMQKFMTYGLPAILFFTLYNISSGLLVYWTVMNFLSILQQMFENSKYAKERKARREAAKATPKMKPGPTPLNANQVLPPKAKHKK